MTTIGQFPIFISAPLSLQSPPLRHRGCHSDREWRADPGAGPPTGLTVGNTGPAPESLGPRSGFSVPVNTALAEEVVNRNELNFSPIFCNNRSILWSRMALQWIWEGVTMSAIINYNATAGLWNNKNEGEIYVLPVANEILVGHFHTHHDNNRPVQSTWHHRSLDPGSWETSLGRPMNSPVLADAWLFYWKAIN